MSADGEAIRASVPRSPWPSFLLRRAGTFIISLWAILTLVFFVAMKTSGDAVRAAAGLSATPEYIAARRSELGLDDPLLTQYFRFIADASRLEFGRTLSSNQPILEVIGQRFPYTLALAGIAFVVSVVIGVGLGLAIAVYAVGRPNSRTESTFHAVTGLLSSIPDYLIAVALVLIFAVGLRALPAAGGSGAASFVLPVVTVSVGLTAVFARLVKSETVRVLREEYIRTARANRIPYWRLLASHVLPNVVTATLTYAGLALAGLMGGMIITETVFDWPGVGSLLVDAILTYDHRLMVALVLLIAGASLLINFAVDVLLAALDPTSMIVRS